MITKVVTLGGPAKHIKVAPVGHGLMTMTVRQPEPVSDEQCFEAIKAGIDELPEGVKMFLNSSQFYSNTWGVQNLEMLARFFEKYPEYADKTFLSVKGSAKLNFNGFQPEFDSREENLRASVDQCIQALRGTKKIDLFECARVDPALPVEEVMATMMKLVDEGKFDYIGLSECGSQSLRRACKVAPVVSAEIEVSLWAWEEETKQVVAAAKELGVNIHAYSPIGHGMLSASFKTLDDLSETDFRRVLSKFSEENFAHNYQVVEIVRKFAANHSPPCTPAQLAIAWVHSLGDWVHPLCGSSKKERTLENLYAGDIVLTDEEKAELLNSVEKIGVKGVRYNEMMLEGLWG